MGLNWLNGGRYLDILDAGREGDPPYYLAQKARKPSEREDSNSLFKEYPMGIRSFLPAVAHVPVPFKNRL